MSFSIRKFLPLGVFSALAAAQSTTPKLEADCADVVMFMARGNDAPYHDIRTFPMVEATCRKFRAQGKTCDYIDINYDVTLGGSFCGQVANGTRSGISQITAFNKKCPCSHIVVHGYSQGAQVIGDVLGGPGGCTFSTTGLDNNSDAGKAIAAALLWGDVMHTANQPYNVLDGASKQTNGRKPDDLARLNRYASVLRSYCAAGDPICANGKDRQVHSNYFELYTDEASSWIVSKIDNTAPPPSCAALSSSSAPAVSSTPIASSTVSSTVAAFSATNATVSKSSAVSSVTSGAGSKPSVPAPTESAKATVSPKPSKVESTAVGKPYPTSPVHVSPFPAPVPYRDDTCILKVHVEYVYV